MLEAAKDPCMSVHTPTHVDHGCSIIYQLQPDSLIPSTFNAYFTTNYVASV